MASTGEICDRRHWPAAMAPSLLWLSSSPTGGVNAAILKPEKNNG